MRRRESNNRNASKMELNEAETAFFNELYYYRFLCALLVMKGRRRS